MARILIIADKADKCCATPRGLQLAAKLGLDVEVVAFAYTSLKPLEGSAAQEVKVRSLLLAKREAEIGEQIEKYCKPGQKVTLKAVWEKNIDRWVINHCASGRYVGVVKGVSGTGTLLHTSTDWQLVRRCPVPVLMVARKRWHRTEPVLVALDLGTDIKSKMALNDKVLDRAVRLADALGVELKIISAIEIPTLLADLDLVDPVTYVKDMKAEIEPHIHKLMARHGVPAEAFHCKHGPAEKVIASYAAKVRAQIVVMGTVARKGVKARLLGNTAEKVLQHLGTDVLAIKP